MAESLRSISAYGRSSCQRTYSIKPLKELETTELNQGNHPLALFFLQPSMDSSDISMLPSISFTLQQQ